VFLIFEVFVLARWVTGPYFKSVPSGPDSPPTWMKAVLISWQVIGIPAAIYVLYRFLVRPWRRDGRPTTDGLIAITCMLLVFQDPFSNYIQNWFTYNTYLVNMGSWVNDIPGWLSYGKPGAMVIEPILWSPFMYCYAFFAITVLGCEFMKRVKRRRPQINDIQLVASCALFMFVVDFVLEGVIFLPLGFYSYGGGHLSIFPTTYHKFPIHEAICTGAMFAAMSSVRYFVNDRGESLAERGTHTLKASLRGKTTARFLAIFAAFNVCCLVFYNAPQTIIGAHSTTWPRDVQQRSYFLDRVCGQGTHQACPGPNIPNARGTSSLNIAPDGRLVIPPGTKLPRPVPFSNRDLAPFHGPLF
jgi:hypothetical protein